MSLNDPLANVLSQISNGERVGKKKCVARNVSTLIKAVLSLLKDNGYILDFKNQKTTKGEKTEILLNGNINKCGIIKPRFSVKKEDYKKFEKRYLPAKDFGIIIISTSEGIMTHKVSKEKSFGGRLIAYCY